MGLFSNANTKQIKKLEKIAVKVEALQEEYKNKSDLELMKMTEIFKQRLMDGETLNDILPEAFATVREASARVLNMRHFHVQILGGIALHQGRIAEMRTGEGKTLVATLATYLNALNGKGVHIVTVNEYLAKTQSELMGKIYKFLGLSVAVNLNAMNDDQKRQAYACDVLYSTNNELGFDYLRDNMVQKKEHKVQRGHVFAIVDEVDSILIDEARTPLIISGRGMKSSETYYTAQRFVKGLKKDDDFEIDEKEKKVRLSESGVEKAERFFKIENLSDIENIELNHHINNALHANFIMKRDNNYIVKDDEIVIVDEFTGRLMPGRRYSEGLHQAIEAKENVKIKEENKTLATITFQNYFRLYNKLSGMTGTAKTEEVEFNGIYKLDVVTIPTNKPMIRKDAPDVIYTTETGKMRAVVREIIKWNETGRPILVGTVSVERSEILSEMLRKEKIKHTVLNAKNHENEAEIIAQAGRLNAVTIATNMAGRGTDILLGGNPEHLAKLELKKKDYTDVQIDMATSYSTQLSDEMKELRREYNKLYEKLKQDTDAEKEKVVALGGLYIIGTERHESRRIDNQLRGRAGRQGDPGASIFFVSMEDELIRRFGGERMQAISNFFKIDEDVPFQSKLLSRQIETAQKRIEAQNYAIRKHVLQFDDVMNRQRQLIYAERDKVLEGTDVHEEIVEMFPDVVRRVVFGSLDPDKPSFEWDLPELNRSLEDRLFAKGSNVVTEEFVDDLEVSEVYDKVLELVLKRYDDLKTEFEKHNANLSEFERAFLLRVVDVLWMTHIDTMEILKREIGLQAYGRRDPIVEYKKEGFELFDKMIEKIREDTCTFLLNIKIEANPNAAPRTPMTQAAPAREQTTTNNEKFTQAKTSKAAGRNDPCPCGSGRKYKNCCGK